MKKTCTKIMINKIWLLLFLTRFRCKFWIQVTIPCKIHLSWIGFVGGLAWIFHALDLKYQLKINASLKHTNQFGSEDLDDCYLSRAAKLKEDWHWIVFTEHCLHICFSTSDYTKRKSSSKFCTQKSCNFLLVFCTLFYKCKILLCHLL